MDGTLLLQSSNGCNASCFGLDTCKVNDMCDFDCVSAANNLWIANHIS